MVEKKRNRRSKGGGILGIQILKKRGTGSVGEKS